METRITKRVYELQVDRSVAMVKFLYWVFLKNLEIEMCLLSL